MNRLSATIKAIVLTIIALVLVQCGNSGSELKVKDSVILSFLKGRIDLSSLAPSAVPGPGDHIVAVALGLDGKNYEAQADATGDFSLSVPAQPYLVCFYLEKADGTRSFVGSVNYDDQGQTRRFMMPGQDLGVIVFSINGDGNQVGAPANTPIPPVFTNNDPDADLSPPPDQVPTNQIFLPQSGTIVNQIILPKSGTLSFQLVRTQAWLMSDLYLVKAGASSPNLLLIDNRSPQTLSLPQSFDLGDEVQLAIEVDGRPLGLPVYRHSSVSGYARVTPESATSWLIEFEDLPYFLADWDFNDLVVRMTLTPECTAPDSECDGLPDAWEAQYAGCGFDPLTPETRDYVAGPIQHVGYSRCYDWFYYCSERVVMAWTGSEYGVSWENFLKEDWNDHYQSDISFVRLGANGVPVGPELRIDEQLVINSELGLVWTGSEFGMAYSADREYAPVTDPPIFHSKISLVRIGADGTNLSGGIEVARRSDWVEWVMNPSLAWAGSEFALAWEDHLIWEAQQTQTDGIYFSRVGADGGKIGPELRITDPPSGNYYSFLAWTGSEYGLSWTNHVGNGNERDIFFARVTAAGAKIGSNLRVTNSPGSSDFSQLAWTGSEFGLSWFDSRDGNDEIYFTRISAAGNKIGADLRVTYDAQYFVKSALFWNGSEFGIAWTRNGPILNQLLFTRISAAGSMIGGEPLVVMETNNLIPRFSMVWTGSEFGLAFRGDRRWNRSDGILFQRIALGLPDRDGDGLHEDEEFAAGTSPCLADTDGDGMPDGWEVHMGGGCGLDPLVNDTAADNDGDGLSNAEEYSLGTDPCNWDTDGDHLADGDELALYLTDPLAPDTDGDRLLDGDEINIHHTDPLMLSTDYDSMDDGWEVMYGPACGIDPLSEDGGSDSDGDGLLNYIEYEINTNPCNPDTDGDQLSDYQELSWSGRPNSDPINPDTDFDGLTDGEEVNVYHTDPSSWDTDGEGLPDGWEVDMGGACGFDPLSRVPDVYYDALGPEVRLTFNTSNSFDPTITWNNVEFGVGWTDTLSGTTQIYFTRLSPEGVKLGTDLRVTSAAGNRFSPAMVWYGEYGLSWEDYRDGVSEVYWNHIGGFGITKGVDFRVTYDAAINGPPSLAWSGSEFAMAWNGGFARLNARPNLTGKPIVSPTILAPGSEHSTLAWTGSEFGVGWTSHNGDSHDYEAFFNRLSATGTKIGGDLQLNGPTMYSWHPLMAWTGSEFGMIWQEQQPDLSEKMNFARISPAGTPIGSVSTLFTPSTSSNVNPALAWTGSEYWVSWGAPSGIPANYEIFLARFTPAGVQIGSDYQISHDPASSDHPAMAWTGSGFGLVWNDLRDGNREIYFARFGEKYTDKDGDGLDDGQEFRAGTNPCAADTDGDGVSDGAEVAAGRDPLDPLH